MTGKTTADAERTALLDKVDVSDSQVDRYLRHLENFIGVEAHTRRSKWTGAAGALYDAAFPRGLAPVDDYIIDENIYCRAAINALKAPEHAATLEGIELPETWIPKFDAAVTASVSAFDKLISARGIKSEHIYLGRDAEIVFVDAVTRLIKFLESRVKPGDKAKELEAKRIMEPLSVAVQKMKAEAAARAMRETKKKGAGTPAAPAKAGDASAASGSAGQKSE